MQRFNKKGFTLIELMVVVGIIGVIALIAVPNFARFQGKAKQANAKTELASMYGMQKAFFTEFGQYHDNLWLIGYTPDGYPSTGSPACPTTAEPAGGGPTRYYKSGSLPSTAMAAVAGVGMTCAGIHAYSATAGSHTLTGATVTATTFTLMSKGTITTGLTDVWTINESKALVNNTMGL